MEENLYRQAARLFHVLSHQGRLQILDELRRGEACVCHLQTVLRRPQPYISQQLRVLREAGIVMTRKDGINMYYRISDRQVERLLKEIMGKKGKPTRTPLCPCPYCPPAGKSIQDNNTD